MTSYKLEHENFMTGHEGTSYLEVAIISSIPCGGCFARDLYVLSDFHGIFGSGLLTDYLLLVLPNIIGVTVLSNHIGSFLLAIVFTTIIFCLHILKKTGQLYSLSPTLNHINLSDRKSFITNFRTVINMCTAVAILAVDFPVFPRRLAKTETFGFGGMDAGVGFFVVANAIVSNEARGKYSILPVWRQVTNTVISSLPLLILGYIRLVTIKGTDYHEHVTEYGVHWNFFFTLAILKIVLTLVYCIIPMKYSIVGAAVFVFVHQAALSNGVSWYIINGLDGAGGRSGYFDANREGICSLPGYIALYMLGVEVGRSFFKPRQNLKEWLTLAKSLAVKYTAFTVIMTVCHLMVEPVSRRFANAAFIFWVMSLSSLMILECLLADIIIAYVKATQKVRTEHTMHPHKPSVDHKLAQRDRNKTLASSVDKDDTSLKKSSASSNHLLDSNVCLIDAISFNSLLFFLLANVLTGAINMSIATLYASDFFAVTVLIIYMFILSFVILGFRRRNFSTKIW